MADKQVTYEIRTDVQGRESIIGLANDLDEVSKVLSGELAPQAQSAAARLRELAKQDAAISGFNRLQAEVRDAGRALKAAETEAANYGKQISAMGPPTAQEAAALQRLQAAAEGARATFTAQQQALASSQAELQRYGISAQNTAAAQQRLRQEVAQVRESVQGLVPAYQNAAAGAKNAGNAMDDTHRKIGSGVESISQQLARLQSFYAGFVGISGLKSMAEDLAATADQVNNLQSRIKLVTGEGENFRQTWQGVTEVALRTHGALQETGDLFTRLAQAGKDAGLSTAAASAQALALTETIGQTIALSGASAEASSAAITQLVQGLQSGVLRGDEFNSVMEQSPRLARALADGLGVSTGELRKMAEAGALTSDAVIKALKGQSEAVASEFAKLPPTVGRALQDLSTQWTLYVAETDKASGVSTMAAAAINALADNLKTIAGLLIDAGQAALAFTALRLAQHFLGIGAAAQSAAAAVAASNAQLVATGQAAAAAAAGASRFATIMASLRTFTLVGIVANFKDIGTWIGETTAKLAGYKDRTEELTRAEKLQADLAKQNAADRDRLAASIQAAIDKQFELSKAARASVAEFDNLTKQGTSSAEAVKKVTDSFDLSKVQGIKDFSAVLDKLAADGKISATELQNAWSQALNGKDLAQFEVTARAAFAGSAREGERVAQMMDSVLREAVKRTGLDFDVLQGKIGAASRSAINDVDALIGGMDKLKQQGVDTGRALTASLSKAIDSADSEKALEVLRAKIEQVRAQLGDKVANGLLDQAKDKADALKDAMDKAVPGINSVREAMKTLGITSDETLRKTAATAKDAYDTMASSGQASAREMGDAFKKAAEAAIAANNGIAPGWVEAQAAMRGYQVEVDKSGKATLTLIDSTNRHADAQKRAAGAVDSHTSALERQNAEQERAIAAQEKANELATRDLQLQEARRKAGTISNVDAVPSFETQQQADAWMAEWKRQYLRDNPFSTNTMGQLGAFGAAMTEFEWQKEVDAMKLRNAMKGSGNASTSSQTPLESMRSSQTVTINLQLNGGDYGKISTNSAGADVLQSYIRQLDLARKSTQ
ncbi:MAG: tape measure protein [Burkholderiaceae bacterium]|nr:tape measure protein [Burkholderiaceae bacterium]